MGEAVVAVAVIAIVFGGVLMWREGLTIFAPRSTGKLAGSADDFCEHRCKLEDGRCPLTGELGRPAYCPLWQFVADDHPTMVYGSPFERESRRVA
jgi:hypothetical protein